LIAHELTHVVQQSCTQRASGSAVRAKAVDPEESDAIRTRQITPRLAEHGSLGISVGVLSRNPVVQRDFALQLPRPRAVGRTLTEVEMRAAIAFNQRVVAVIGADGISQLRDVLGVSPAPSVIDEDFVSAVVQWQAAQGIDQDGQLGPRTARPLFREIGAESAGRAELASGPSYSATMALTPPVVGGRQQTGFRLETEFQQDPANGINASCGEVRQFIQWDAAAAAALPGGIPHAGFPAGTAADVWIEDRDTADLRYGHRSGAHAESIDGNSYLDTTGTRNPAFGHIYRGRDFPGGPDALLAGHWRFFARAYDVCNGNRALGTDYLRITW
jgi:hypothetical protein